MSARLSSFGQLDIYAPGDYTEMFKSYVTDDGELLVRSQIWFCFESSRLVMRSRDILSAIKSATASQAPIFISPRKVLADASSVFCLTLLLSDTSSVFCLTLLLVVWLDDEDRRLA